MTGAKFGWHQGAKALELLIAIDRRVERAWLVGWKNEALARAAVGGRPRHAG